MYNFLIILPILIPIFFGGLIPILSFDNNTHHDKKREIYVASVVIINALLIFFLLFNTPENSITLFRLPGNFHISLHIDGLSKVFMGLVGFLWPLASFYAFEYMEHSENKNRFFCLYTITFGITCGIAMSANLITMYFFYELLTLITIPLVMHDMNKRAVHAGIKYMIYSIAGAACAFAGMMILVGETGTSLEFKLGGFLNNVTNIQPHLVIAFFLCFFGFGVKAAIFPLHGWLPSAGVAPTPVTALLHAVAVVKAGVFALMRVVYFGFGISIFKGTYVQYIAMAFAIWTILYGSSMALKEQQIKRRLAYSTISNLSYIVFAITLMSSYGFFAAMSHMLFHGFMKITLFFCAGAIMHKSNKEYIPDFKGFARKMPVTFATFSIASMALTGVPLLCGFVSKYNIAIAAVRENSFIAFVGIIVLLISAYLTAKYLFDVVIKAYFPGKDFNYETINEVEDPSNYMKIPFIILCIIMFITGIYSQPIMNFLNGVAGNLF
ncbi:MAG: proton-conducting transporter membrane subunit [Eubacteriales bacterium]|nr:proton-conducting transporter membrane subunit [Eubacteriales bacterium]